MNVLGTYDGHDVILKNGKFGYYLVYNGVNFSIKHATPERKHQIIDKHNIEEAIALIELHKKQETNPVIKVPPKGAFEIRLGPYGYYFTHNKKFYSIGKREPDSLTEQDCYDIINEKYNGDKIDLGPTHMNLQPALHYSRKKLPKIKPFIFKSSKKVKSIKPVKLAKPEKSIKPEKNRSSCVYNEGTNRCRYGSPHDAEKCVLNANGHCERHVVKAAKSKVSIRKPRCKNGSRRNQQGECVPK
jgi:topoisomerase IA-like protein